MFMEVRMHLFVWSEGNMVRVAQQLPYPVDGFHEVYTSWSWPKLRQYMLAKFTKAQAEEALELIGTYY
jgi:hypothetical protein